MVSVHITHLFSAHPFLQKVVALSSTMSTQAPVASTSGAGTGHCVAVSSSGQMGSFVLRSGLGVVSSAVTSQLLTTS